MWKSRFDRHCSDDLLLAYLDGELGGFAGLRAAAHLRRCWDCRARLSELENQAESLARLVKTQAAGHVDRSTRARTEFLVWKEQFERGRQPALRGPSHTWRWALAGACVLAAIFLVPRPAEHSRESAHSAAGVLRGVEGFQKALRGKPGTLHQVLTVEVSQSRPLARRSAGRVEIWSDRAAGRYASRWVDERQVLRYAVWRRQGREPLRYAAAGTRAAGPLFDPSPESLTVEGLERAFFEWLGSRDWQAAPDFSEAVARDSSQVRVEPMGSGGFRVHAVRSQRTVKAEFTMEVEAGTYRPRLQVMRLESDTRALELRVVADRLEVVAQVQPAVFEPDMPRPPAPPPLVREAPAPPPAVPSAPSAEELATEVLYAVHQAHACVGGNIEITTAPGGNVEVRAMVPDAARAAALAEALERIGVRGEIRIVAHPRPGPERAHPLVEGEGLRLMDALYLESLGLVRLAERYGPDRASALTPRQQELVEIMLRDHVAALAAATRAARREVEPALAGLAGAPPAVEVPEAADWAATATAVFRALDRADNRIDVPPGAGRKQAAAEVLGALAEVELRVGRMTARR